MYAYRRKADGKVWLYGDRPYCTKAAAKTGLKNRSGLINQQVPLDPEKDRYGRSWRFLSTAEMEAILARDFELVTYELREMPSEACPIR